MDSVAQEGLPCTSPTPLGDPSSLARLGGTAAPHNLLTYATAHQGQPDPELTWDQPQSPRDLDENRLDVRPALPLCTSWLPFLPASPLQTSGSPSVAWGGQWLLLWLLGGDSGRHCCPDLCSSLHLK